MDIGAQHAAGQHDGVRLAQGQPGIGHIDHEVGATVPEIGQRQRVGTLVMYLNTPAGGGAPTGVTAQAAKIKATTTASRPTTLR